MLLNREEVVLDERQLFGKIQFTKSRGWQVARVGNTLNPAQIYSAE
ncbi:hypothetical protein [Microcoleus vaginatus]